MYLGPLVRYLHDIRLLGGQYSGPRQQSSRGIKPHVIVNYNKCYCHTTLCPQHHLVDNNDNFSLIHLYSLLSLWETWILNMVMPQSTLLAYLHCTVYRVCRAIICLISAFLAVQIVAGCCREGFSLNNPNIDIHSTAGWAQAGQQR